MRAILLLLAVLIILAMIVAAVILFAAEAGRKAAVNETKPQTKADATPARPKITVSKETTYITAPLLPDGYPDYFSALNEICGAGVTPENNAAVAFWQAVGPPRDIDKELRPQFFKKLGIKELPEEGEYLLSFYRYAERKISDTDGYEARDKLRDLLTDQRTRAAEKPWSKSEYPEYADYLAANEKPLQILLQGIERPRYYTPLVGSGDEGILDSNFSSGLGDKRDAGCQLLAQAMLKLNGGQTEDAMQYLLAAHRFARLLQQGPFLVDLIVAYVTERIACKADAALIQHASLANSQAVSFLADFRRLPPFASIADKWNVGERIFILDNICIRAKSSGNKGDHTLELIAQGFNFPLEEKSLAEALKKLAANPRVDWDEVARGTNARLDRIVEANKSSNYKQRCDTLDKMNAEDRDLLRKTVKLINEDAFVEKDASPKVLAQYVHNILTIDHGKAVMTTMNRLQMEVSLVELAFVLASYRAVEGKYPATLADLPSKNIPAIPKDIFTDKELIYKPRENGQGYLLYSVGPNGRDNGGRNYDDDPDKYKELPEDQRPDDIVIHMP
jgi:hypothetical protein